MPDRPKTTHYLDLRSPCARTDESFRRVAGKAIQLLDARRSGNDHVEHVKSVPELLERSIATHKELRYPSMLVPIHTKLTDTAILRRLNAEFREAILGVPRQQVGVDRASVPCILIDVSYK